MAVSRPVASAPSVQNPYFARPDWFYPTAVVVVFSIFILYGLWVTLFFPSGRFGPYLSPFTSPEFDVRIAGFHIPTGIWIAWVPLLFRLSCYYYRKAYYRSFLFHPRSCAHVEPSRGAYHGETRFWIFNNLHRFIFYLTALQVLVLWYDTIAAFAQHGQLGAAVGLGNFILLINVVALSAYTFGCHAFRHLVGGGKDCFSCTRTRYRLWKGVTVLNVDHEVWAWVSMFTVWGTDLYFRLLIMGALPHGAWN